MASRDLPVDRLATTDAEGHRLYVYPSDVKGKFRDWRDRFFVVLILIFLGMPWLRIGEQQAVLLDIPRRRFAIFGVTFWAHDAPMMFFVVGGFALTLFFITAIWGRVWCGWACPQTVFIDGVFRRIEHWIEGDSVQRRRRDEGPVTREWLVKKILKWFSFVAVTLVITHSFLAYFVGTDELFRMIRTSPAENPASFLVMLISSGIILFDFGWFREQFCTIACPYGRFQSVLMDDHSMIIGYDRARGEPRKGLAAEGRGGDCVNCFRCVQVCPTGIDIRRGVQLECIACTACADACDDVMSRLKKPVGLIRYTSLEELSGGKWTRFGGRAFAYSIVLALLTAGLTYRLMTRKELDYTFIRYVGMPYEVVTSAADGKPEVLNHYKIDFSNQSFDELEVRITPLAAATGEFQLITPLNPLPIAPGTNRRTDLFVRFPKESLKSGKAAVQLDIASVNRKSGKETRYQETLRLVGPYQ